MDRYVAPGGTETWFIFERRFRCYFSHGMHIHGVGPHDLKMGPGGAHKYGPYVHIHCLDQAALRGWCDQCELPLQATYRGAWLGDMHENDGYARAADGGFCRTITGIDVTLLRSGEELAIEIAGTASPLLPETPPLRFNKSHLLPLEFKYRIAVPAADVPDFLELTEEQATRFLSGWKRRTSAA